MKVIKEKISIPADFFFHFKEIPNIKTPSYLDISRFKGWLDLYFYFERGSEPHTYLYNTKPI
jgi:nucleoside-specific outer membrane channel protein Tsx